MRLRPLLPLYARLRPLVARLLAEASIVLWLPALTVAVLTWPRVAAGVGLGRVRTVNGKDVITNIPTFDGYRLTRYGWAACLTLRYGDTLDTITTRTAELSTAWLGDVRLSRIPGHPNRVQVMCLRRDPFRVTVPAPRALSATKLEVGRCEDGSPFVVDLDVAPHWLSAGATGSGKSGGTAAIAAALCQSPAAICMVDLKHGVSAAPMAPRASVIAETRPEAVKLFRDLLALGAARAKLCKAAGVDHVRDLADRPPEIVVLVDEVAELAVSSGQKLDKDEAAEVMGLLLRSVQLLRAFGVHVLLSGQRFGSSIGPRVTDVRAQLTGRIAYRSNDTESADMTVGDISRAAVHAAQAIPVDLPGVAVANVGPDGWRLVRMAHVTHSALGRIAADTAGNRLDWSDVMAEVAAAPPEFHIVEAGEHLTGISPADLR